VDRPRVNAGFTLHVYTMDLRCFIAIEIPEPIKDEIGRVVDLLKKYDADVKWVAAANFHITLKFLGNTPESLMPGIKTALSSVAASYQPFYIKIKGTGVFPGRKNPRVCWVGIEGSDILKKLKEDIEISMLQFGFQKEDKDFNPHMTIGRVRSLKGIVNVVNELAFFQEQEFGAVDVANIKIMKSDLKPGGPEYTCLYDIPFGKE
jgi:RNA 2',3'-cyclic 3'-phosphodiesterase